MIPASNMMALKIVDDGSKPTLFGCRVAPKSLISFLNLLYPGG